jgi:predicted dehydrogenase
LFLRILFIFEHNAFYQALYWRLMTMTDSTNALPDAFSRRQFLAAAGAAALAPTLSFAQGQAPAGKKVKIGLIGCGGRGVWIAKLFQNHGGYEFVAGADYFQDRVANFGKQLGVPEANLFTGLNAYKKLLEVPGLEAVAIISPPYFHPEQAAAAVAAGKHVYLAKPMAVDVPGCQTVEQSGKQARAKKQVFLIDFQTRATPFYQEAVKRVHAGGIGTLCFGNAFYHCGRLGRQADPSGGPEARLRNWVFDIKLSGDIIVEQNIHTLDVMNWVMRKPPVQCTATGGRKGRVDVGDCWDHYAGLFEYEDGIGFTFSSKQYDCEGPNEGIILNVFGTKGSLITNYGGEVMIRGGKDAFYRGGKTTGIYQAGAVTNISTFYQSIQSENFANPTLEPAIQSNLVAILGRTATRQKQTVTWQEMLQKAEKFEADLSGLKA